MHYLRPPPSTTFFPYTTLFRSRRRGKQHSAPEVEHQVHRHRDDAIDTQLIARKQAVENGAGTENKEHPRLSAASGEVEEDRKSTRLNSSHSQISYAVFCLKKKK